MIMKYFATSNRGCVRPDNEDCILIGNEIVRDSSDSFSFPIPETGIVFPAFVCDGVGGNAAGEVASMTVCEYFKTFFETLKPGLDDNELFLTLKQQAKLCNEQLLALAAGSGMATTLTGVLVYGNKGYVLNAGDSKTYRLRYGNLKQINRQHTVANEGRRVISNCFGMPDVTIDITPTAIVEGDVFVICSDGLFDMVPDEMIAANARNAEVLSQLAMEHGGLDNISIIVLEF